jgi:hypothetical protein
MVDQSMAWCARFDDAAPDNAPPFLDSWCNTLVLLWSTYLWRPLLLLLISEKYFPSHSFAMYLDSNMFCGSTLNLLFANRSYTGSMLNARHINGPWQYFRLNLTDSLDSTANVPCVPHLS